MKSEFLLNPDIVFLNHGSFGACPKQVLDKYHQLQRNLESEPVKFLGRDLWSYLAKARAILGKYVGADADDLTFVPNATYGMNSVIHSLDLGPGDEVLTTNFEYGAVDNAWSFYAARQGFIVKVARMDPPYLDSSGFIQRFSQYITESTKVVSISQITSPTAVIFPIREIVQLCRERGILSVIDGAHSPAFIDLNLNELDGDFFTGNCHKWMMAPKGAAFLWVNKKHQDKVMPLTVGWGWKPQISTGNKFIDWHEFQGTKDYCAFLSVPECIEFMETRNWHQVRQSCRDLAYCCAAKITDITGLQNIADNIKISNGQMIAFPLPDNCDIDKLKTDLYNRYRIEIPCIFWSGRKFIRISVQAYNNRTEIDYFLESFKKCLPETLI